MKSISIAVTQMSCTLNRLDNIRQACDLVEQAAEKGAQVVLLQELFETPYFCIDIDPVHYTEATTVNDNPAIAKIRKLAEKLNVVVPVSFYELDEDGRRFNSLAMIDAGGDLLGIYRKSHIPDFPAYEEVFYFSPGDTGFRVWDTKYLRIGCGVCWDQWFPEVARIMSVMGAELLMYPTAIGRPTEYASDQPMNTKPHWQLTMQGHAAANQVILMASNRIGIETGKDQETNFYGSSFIANATGTKVLELDEETRSIGVMEFDFDKIAEFRKSMGIYRTRRNDLYEPIRTQTPPEYLRTR